jgi:hypothetical protein
MTQTIPGDRKYSKTKMLRGQEYKAIAFFNFSPDASQYLLVKKSENKKLRGFIESFHYSDARLHSLYVVYTRRLR